MISSQELLLQDKSTLIKLFRAVLENGAKLIQYRNKHSTKVLTHMQILLQLDALAKLCQEYKAKLIVNDNIDLAQKVQIQGLHLGKMDKHIRLARNKLGKNKIIGVSCYNSLKNINSDIEENADYISLGTFFSSNTKSGTKRASKQIIKQAKKTFDLPIVAIGGINHNNGKQLVELGVDSIAVIDAIFGELTTKSVAMETKKLSKLFI